MKLPVLDINPYSLTDVTSLQQALVRILNIVEEQHQTILSLKEENQKLKETINHLKLY